MSNEVSIFENDNAVAAPSNRKSSLAQKLSSQNTIYSRMQGAHSQSLLTVSLWENQSVTSLRPS
jgi:hypothetical protein